METIKVINISRIKNSRNGNARFELELQDGTKRQTAADSSYAADVENAYHAWDGASGLTASVEYNGWGKITRFTALAFHSRV
jgi:hypothetical protein